MTGVSSGESTKILGCFDVLNISLQGGKTHTYFVSIDGNETLIVNSVLFDLKVILKEQTYKSEKFATVILLLH